MTRIKPFLIFCTLALVMSWAAVAGGQQLPDLEFNTSVENPAYKREGPRVVVDEAHHSFRTSVGRYKPFVDLISNDGYRVIRNRQSFGKITLSSYKILVIANALGAEEDDDEGSDKSAFTDDEIQAVQEWVKGGGALLLMTDQLPSGGR